MGNCAPSQANYNGREWTRNTRSGIIKIYQLTAAEAINSLRCSAHGLSQAVAAKRLQEYGANKVPDIS